MANEITNKVLLEHIQGMEKRMRTDFKTDLVGMEKRMRVDFKTDLGDLKKELKQTESNLTERINALEEDLTATMHDTIRIRRHVGMPVASE